MRLRLVLITSRQIIMIIELYMVWMLAHKTIELIIAAERQRGSTLFLAFHSIQSFARNYVKSNLDLVSVIPSDCRNSGEQYIRRLFWVGGGDQTIFLIACACFRLLISMWSSFIQYHASLQVIYCKRIIKKRTFFFEWTWLYFFLPIFIKAMKFLMFILEVSNVLLWLCRCFLQPEIFYYPRGRR